MQQLRFPTHTIGLLGRNGHNTSARQPRSHFTTLICATLRQHGGSTSAILRISQLKMPMQGGLETGFTQALIMDAEFYAGGQ